MIRLSSRLQAMPEWVVDYVLVHELAHLPSRRHGPAVPGWSSATRAERTQACLEVPGLAPGRGNRPARLAWELPGGRRRLMLTWDQGGTLADRFRSHAGEAHPPVRATRCAAMADDWEAGGPVRTICAGYEQAPHGSALPLRLLAGVFRLVLTDQAPELVPFYPCLGGDDDPARPGRCCGR